MLHILPSCMTMHDPQSLTSHRHSAWKHLELANCILAKGYLGNPSWVKVSLSLVNGAFSAIGANGDNEWRQWMLHCRQWRFGEWRQWRSQSPLAPMATSIGANGDRHWRPLAPFKWRHLIHSMAILSLQSPFRVSGSFGDSMAPIDPVAQLTPMATMAIHLIQ